MNQLLENGKKSSSRPDFDAFGPILSPKILFRRFYLY